MKIQFERAEKEDAKRLVEVQKNSFKADYEIFGQCPPYEESIEDIEEMIDKLIVYKIIVNENIVGDIIIKKNSDSECYLRTICIIPELQNKGIGGKAMEFIEKSFPEICVWFLRTPKGSQRNCHFYEKSGYKLVSHEDRTDKLTLCGYLKKVIK